MKQVSISIRIENSEKLIREISEDGILGVNFLSLSTKQYVTIFNFQDAFSSGDESHLRYAFLPNFVDEDNSLDFKAKITSLVSEAMQDVPFCDIDYTININPNLHPKRTFMKGELRKVEWFSHSMLTDKVVEVDISYNRDPYGFAISRETTRKWLMNNGDFHDDQKITTKFYDKNVGEQVVEVKRRRRNVVDNIQKPTMDFMVETMAPLSAGSILLIFQDFLTLHESDFHDFIETAPGVIDINDADFGKKIMVVTMENAVDSWLDNIPPSLGGVLTIRDWIVQELSI